MQLNKKKKYYRAKSFIVNWPSFVRDIASAASHDAI